MKIDFKTHFGVESEVNFGGGRKWLVALCGIESPYTNNIVLSERIEDVDCKRCKKKMAEMLMRRL